MKVILLLAALALLICISPVRAQDHKTKTVSVDIGGRVLAAATTSNPIPFDEAFALTGTATGVERIELTYRIDPSRADYARYYGLDEVKNQGQYQIKDEVKGFELAVYKDSLYLVVRENKLTYHGTSNPSVIVDKTVSGNTTHITYAYANFLVIDGTNKKNCSRIDSHHYYPDLSRIGADGFTREPEVWNRPDDAATTFYLNAGPLHDNLTYNFRFKIFLKNNIADKQDELANKIVALLKSQLKFESLNSMTGQDERNLGQSVTVVIKSYTDKRGDLVMGKGDSLQINLRQAPFDVLKNQVVKASSRILDLQAVKTEARIRLIDQVPPFLPGNLPNAPYGGLKKDILRIGAGTVWEPAAQLVWDSDIPGFTCKVKDIAAIIADGSKLLEVFQGTKKIDANGTLSAIGTHIADPASVGALSYFCQAIIGHEMSAKISPDPEALPLFRTTGFRRFYNYMETLAAATAAGDNETVKQVAKEVGAATPGLLNDPVSPLAPLLLQVISQQHLAEPTKKMLDQPLNASVVNYKAMKISDALTLLYNGFRNPNIFMALIGGSGKISGTYQNVEPTTDGQVDMQSLQVLISIFSLMDSPAFLDDQAALIFLPATHAGLIAGRLSYYQAKLNAIGPEVTDYTAFKDQFTRLMADTYIKKTFLLSGASMVDQSVDANKNPYVGLDAGFGYAFRSHTMFIHEGLNIYLRPINRDAPISTLHGRDYWLKTMSLFIGITQNVSSSNVNDKYANLFDESGLKTSLLFGAGWRFSTLARLNIAGLVYREKSLNPLVTATQVRVSPSVTLSIDVSLAKLFKSFTSVF